MADIMLQVSQKRASVNTAYHALCGYFFLGLSKTKLSINITSNPNSSTFNYHRADWDQYRTFMEYNFDPNVPLQTKDDINNALDSLTTSIVEARTASVPKCEVKFNSIGS